MPAHCDAQVRKIEEDIKTSNKKFKAGNIASCLSNWKEIISDRWVLSTIKGTNIEFEDITQIPLAQRNPQKHERDSNIFRQEIYFKKVQLSQLQIINEGTFPQSF